MHIQAACELDKYFTEALAIYAIAVVNIMKQKRSFFPDSMWHSLYIYIANGIIWAIKINARLGSFGSGKRLAVGGFCGVYVCS